MRVCLKLLLHYVALFEIHSVSSIPKVVQLWPCYFSDPLDIHCCFILEGMMSAQCDNVLAPHVVLLFPAHRFSNMNTMVSSTATTSIFFCFVIRDSGYMTTHQRRCLQCLSAQLLVCDKNLNCNCQRHQATLSIAGTLLFPTVDVSPQDP